MVRKTWLLIFCTLPLLLSSGCLGVTSLDDRAIVELLAVDWDGSEYEIQLSLFQAQENVTAQAGGETVQNLISGRGNTMAQAMASASSQAGKELFFANNELILLGEQAAGVQLNFLLTYVNANPQIRPSVRLLITQGAARDFLQEQASDQLAKNLLGTLENAQEEGLLSSAQLIDVLRQLEGPKGCAPIPIVGSGQEQLEQVVLATPQGIALVLQQREAYGASWLTDRVRARLLSVTDGSGEPVTLRASAGKGRIHLTETDPLSYTLELSVTLRVEESMAPIEPEEVPDLEHTVEQAIEQEVQHTLQATTLDRGLDLVGLSAALRQQNPSYYRDHREELGDLLQQAQIQVQVSARLERVGMQASQ